MTEQVTRLLETMQQWAADAGDHTAPGGDEGGDCTWCPVCRAADRVRDSSPEVRAHLTSAATSLLSAAASLLEGIAAHQRGDETGGTPTE